ncbi:LOW QUALITY PROTEIN: zf-RVT domain-containing protein, partial [Cephalotus follicularis]
AGTLPLKYLGLPLVSRGLSAADCKCLSLRMADMIQNWTSKCLSYAGRAQLIQATLSGVKNFWLHNMVLPKATMKECESIMRRYLWAGSGGRKRSKISWARVCKPKDEGGLGLRRATDCNKATIMKLGTFTWKTILQLRPIVTANLVYSVGRDSSWSMWFDPWLHNTSLVERLGVRAIYDTGLPREATLSEVIQESRWSWPSHVWQLWDIRHESSNINIVQRDSLGWQKVDGSFSFKQAWDSIRTSALTVPWSKVVWFNGGIPKHAFCMWLTFLNAHCTLDKLHLFGAIQSNLCPFGCGQCETVDHLFFDCAFTKTV